MKKEFIKKFVKYVKTIYNDTDGEIPLHAPIFVGKEKEYLNETIDSTFVSSVGKFVSQAEKSICDFTGSNYAVAICNGTLALHLALVVSGVKPNDDVITQSLSFVATSNAIKYIFANPVFIDVDYDTMGLSPEKLLFFLEKNAEIKNGNCYNKLSGNKISACVPMHTFGFPCRIDEISEICEQWNITLIEDSAESIGSYYNTKHTGLFGKCGVLSFNGNKTITSGGGGMIITNDKDFAIKSKHLSTTAKVPHKWEFKHDDVGYNYRMPNLNAALLLAQMELLPDFIKVKNEIHLNYRNFFNNTDIQFVEGIENTQPNYWLNTILLSSNSEKEEFLKITNENGINTRPAWNLLSESEIFKNCLKDDLSNTKSLFNKIVNIPSGLTKEMFWKTV